MSEEMYPEDCIYCDGTGVHGDELTGGESYCAACPDGEVAKLRDELKELREAYYNLEPKATDAVYDAKLERLRELSPNDFEVRTVGAAVPKLSVWEKVQHKIPMGSLSKVNSEAELRDWAARIHARTDVGDLQTEFLFTYKIDGSSMELVYEGGKLVRCVTRGDGVVGEDVTDNVRKIPDVPATIPITEEVTIRGEVVMTKEVFERVYAAEYSNPRNTANGKVREKKGGGEDCRNMQFIAYTLMSDTAPNKEALRFKILEKMKFTVPFWQVVTLDEVQKLQERLAAGEREKIPYEIDGTVIRLNDIAKQEELGDLNMRPRGQIAYKFEAATGVTTVEDIKWQVGNSGRVTPVASVAPVNIGGVTITSISLHNLSMFRELSLFRGCKVLVERRNDVIPYLKARI
jgi:DNA ligase (NAD+)